MDSMRIPLDRTRLVEKKGLTVVSRTKVLRLSNSSSVMLGNLERPFYIRIQEREKRDRVRITTAVAERNHREIGEEFLLRQL